MGYTTTFSGQFNITPPLSDADRKFLTKLSQTRRMGRNLGPEYGIQGEWYVDSTAPYGQDHDANIIDYNTPPATQPGLWCQWIPTADGSALVWDGGEKFYYYKEWMCYLIEKYLAPRGYTVNGNVTWQGEDPTDTGTISVVNNTVEALYNN